MDADLIDLDITGVAHGGVFVGRHEGRVVFVPDAIPGERVRVRLTDAGAPGDTRSFWRGEAIEILDASPHRRPHVWSAADVSVPPEQRPGGADFGHIQLEHQRELKTQVLTDALTRIGKLDLPVSLKPAAGESADGTGWRTRVSLHVDDEGRIGPFAARSHRVIPVDDLPLATPEVAEAARGLTSGGRDASTSCSPPTDGSASSPAPKLRAAPPPVDAGARRRGRPSRTRPLRRSSSRRSAVGASGSTPAASGRCTATRRTRSRSSWHPSFSARGRSTRTPGTSISTAEWASSRQRWESSADPPRASPPWSPMLGRPSTPARTSRTGWAHAPRPRASTAGSRGSRTRHPMSSGIDSRAASCCSTRRARVRGARSSRASRRSGPRRSSTWRATRSRSRATSRRSAQPATRPRTWRRWISFRTRTTSKPSRLSLGFPAAR